MKNTRIFYNKITDVAYINNNNFIRETSNQLRNYKNSKFKENSVFINGTHNFIKRLRGPVFSFLYSVSANTAIASLTANSSPISTARNK